MLQTMNFSMIFEVPPKVIYNALIDPLYKHLNNLIMNNNLISEVTRYTRCPTQFKPEINGKFELYGGKIVGVFLELVK